MTDEWKLQAPADNLREFNLSFEVGFEKLEDAVAELKSILDYLHVEVKESDGAYLEVNGSVEYPAELDYETVLAEVKSRLKKCIPI